MLVLHPTYKLQYFKDADWQNKWIETAKEIVCEEFKQWNQTLEIEEIDASEASQGHEAATQSVPLLIIFFFYGMLI